MRAELASVDQREGADDVDALPVLRAVRVARSEDVDQLVQGARAELAILALQLRTALQRAHAAEARPAGPDRTDARLLLEAGLDHTLAVRRRSFEDALTSARSDAALVVAAARGAAADLVAAANDELFELLLGGLGPAAPMPPSLRVVGASAPSEETVPPSAADEHPRPVDARGRGERAGGATQSVAAHPAGGRVLAVERDVVVAGREGVAADSEPTVVAEPPMPAVAAVETAPLVADVAPIRPPLLRRFLYVDVLLPMLAVLIVLAVLLAWVG